MVMRIFGQFQESASLADRLIQYQLTRAQEAEETYALKNELSLTKQKLTGTQKQLKEAEALIGDIKERVSWKLLEVRYLGMTCSKSMIGTF